MISIPISRVEDAIDHFKSEIDDFVATGEKNLIKLGKTRAVKARRSESKYVKLLARHLHKIVRSRPYRFPYYLKMLALPAVRLKKDARRRKAFNKAVLKCLAYASLRKEFYPEYFRFIGIKACVYCNSQLAVTIDSQEGPKAKFQVDHYIPKAENPWLSISLYNLYPVCANCNNSKREDRVRFDLYSKKNGPSQFRFRLARGVLAKYLNTWETKDIKIKFKEPSFRKGKIPFKSFNTAFDIDGIYKTQIDVAEELILKSVVYTKAYRKLLAKNFDKLFTDVELDRLIVGTYLTPTEIHKRPMSKFSQDIARQLRLIK